MAYPKAYPGAFHCLSFAYHLVGRDCMALYWPGTRPIQCQTGY